MNATICSACFSRFHTVLFYSCIWSKSRQQERWNEKRCAKNAIRYTSASWIEYRACSVNVLYGLVINMCVSVLSCVVFCTALQKYSNAFLCNDCNQKRWKKKNNKSNYDDDGNDYALFLFEFSCARITIHSQHAASLSWIYTQEKNSCQTHVSHKKCDESKRQRMDALRNFH